jgi:hypothetical protein
MGRERQDRNDGRAWVNEDAAATVPPGAPGAATTEAAAADCSAAPDPPRRRRTRGPDKPSADGQVSGRRMAAKRANAARSTGPRSEAGKSVARFNALRHGLAAQTALLPGEDDEALADLTADFEADHAGSSAAERAVAGRLVSVVWKLRRLARAEEAVAAGRKYARTRAWATRRAVMGQRLPKDGKELDGPDPMPLDSHGPQILADDLGSPGDPGRLERLMLWDVRLGGELMRACRQLTAVRKAMGERPPEGGERDDGESLDAGPADGDVGDRGLADDGRGRPSRRAFDGDGFGGSGRGGLGGGRGADGLERLVEMPPTATATATAAAAAAAAAATPAAASSPLPPGEVDGRSPAGEGERRAGRCSGRPHGVAARVLPDAGDAGMGPPDAGEARTAAEWQEVNPPDVRPLTLTLSPEYGGEGTGGGSPTPEPPRMPEPPGTPVGPPTPQRSQPSDGPHRETGTGRSAVVVSAERTHCSAGRRTFDLPSRSARGPARRVVIPVSPGPFDARRPPRPWTATVEADGRPARGPQPTDSTLNRASPDSTLNARSFPRPPSR